MQFATFAQIVPAFNATGTPEDIADKMSNDDRLRELTDWLAGFDGLGRVQPVPASTDASFRRYFRIGNGHSYVAMDAPPPQEDCRPFAEIAGYLEAMGLNAPRIVQADFERGFLLLTDLGADQYLSVIGAQPDRADSLYRDAMDALLVMHEQGGPYQGRLPAYDEDLLRFELALFHDWLCQRHLGIAFSNSDEAAWRDCCDLLVSNALEQPAVFVHRDYHSRNLMVTPSNNPGILDFQDAVEGPLTYDLVSLLKDCYVKFPDDVIRDRALYCYARMPVETRNLLDERRFLHGFELMGVQRHLKAAGIFARLLHRDGKTGYLKDVPRTLSYVVDLAPRHPAIEPLVRLVADRVLPALQARVA
jgi:aminoglycoside/choline kinase family phosphotransferase